MIISNILVVVGFFVVFLVFKENSFTSSIIEVDKEQKVISTGPYSVVRHPMYSGATIILTFTPISLGSYWGLLIVIPLIFIIILRLLNEEKYLSVNLEFYKEYCQAVRFRLVPGIW